MEVLGKLKHGFSYTDFQTAVIEVMMKHENFENSEDLFQRGKAFKRFLKEFLLLNPLPEGEKMAIVCHSMFIAALTCDHVDGFGEHSHLVHYTWLLNCQTIGWNGYKEHLGI